MYSGATPITRLFTLVVARVCLTAPPCCCTITLSRLLWSQFLQRHRTKAVPRIGPCGVHRLVHCCICARNCSSFQV
ncbi:hypothetical protein JOM56_007820 [Amanita muscaria]